MQAQDYIASPFRTPSFNLERRMDLKVKTQTCNLQSSLLLHEMNYELFLPFLNIHEMTFILRPIYNLHMQQYYSYNVLDVEYIKFIMQFRVGYSQDFVTNTSKTNQQKYMHYADINHVQLDIFFACDIVMYYLRAGTVSTYLSRKRTSLEVFSHTYLRRSST